MKNIFTTKSFNSDFSISNDLQIFSKFNIFIILLLFPVLVFAQDLDHVILRQELLFRIPLSTKDYGLHGSIQKLQKMTSYSDTQIPKTYETLFFSGKGLLTKREFYREGEKDATVTSYYHYSNKKIDSITTNTHTEKEVFNYDNNNRLIKKITYGKYEETRDEIDEVENFYYNSQDYIIKSVKDLSNLITECKYNSNSQLIQIKSFYSDNPKDTDVTEYQFQTSDKPHTAITKENGKIQTTFLYKFDTKGNNIETTIISPDKTGKTIKNNITYDSSGNIISNVTLNNGSKTSVLIQEIEYQ